MQWLKMHAWKVGGRWFETPSGIQVSKVQNVFSLPTRNIVGSLRDRDVACSASDRQGWIFESCVWRAVSSYSTDHPQ